MAKSFWGKKQYKYLVFFNVVLLISEFKGYLIMYI